MSMIVPMLLFLIFIMLYRIKTLEIKNNNSFVHNISVIIPARNEEINLPTILSRLKNQTVRPYEIIVVDDGSEDKTRQIAESFGARVIEISNSPKDWRGKPFACFTGAKNASGDILLFLDADIIFKENAIEKLLSTFKEGSVLSVQPYHYTKKLYEQFSLFFNVIMLAGVGACLPGKEKSIGLFGPVIMVDRSVYFKIGGHEIVKDKVAEDLHLGNYLREKNIPCDMYLGYDSISFQMYKGGLSDLVWGWSKNFATGASKTPFINLLIVVFWLASYYAIIINLVQYSTSLYMGENVLWMLLINIALYFIAGVVLYIKTKKIGRFSLLMCIFYFIPLTAFTLIFTFSLILKYIVKKVKWKGRWYKI